MSEAHKKKLKYGIKYWVVFADGPIIHQTKTKDRAKLLSDRGNKHMRTSRCSYRYKVVKAKWFIDKD